MYARLNNEGRLELFRSRHIKEEGRLIVNPSAATLARHGYKPIKESEPPKVEGGQVLRVEYRDAGESIECVYTLLGGEK